MGKRIYGRPAVLRLVQMILPSIGLVLVIVANAEPAISSNNHIVVDTHWDRFGIQDVCSNENRNLRLYLDYGDSGWVSGHPADVISTDRGNTKSGSKSSVGTNGHQQQRRPKGPSSCTLELVTCPSCRFKVVASSINIANEAKCSEGRQSTDTKLKSTSINSSVNEDAVCRCNYLAFSEPQFEADVIRRQFCNGILNHQTEYTGFTRSVLMQFVFAGASSKDSFNLTFESERNLDEVIGHPIDVKKLSVPTYQPAAVIASPYFPTLCSRDIIKQHLIRCEMIENAVTKKKQAKGSSSEENTGCSIRLIFTDFQIDMMSRMELYNSVGHLIHMYSGDIFRPPVILVPGPSMLVRFYANGASENLRYRADVDFIRTASIPNELDLENGDVLQPTTECGGSVDTLGGAITMMNMVSNESQSKRYDCVWLIRPSRRYVISKPFLSFRISEFSGFDARTELVIREGQTSSQPIVESIHGQNVQTGTANPLINREFVVNTTTGFYVSFKGSFGVLSKLALVYTVFAMESKSSTGFVCKNLKCIPIQLQCDGFDHCGDSSDEPESCTLAWNHETSDRRWYSHTPNYYFPKTDHYPDLRAATIVFLVSSIGLIFLISGIIILLYRMGHWARDNHDLQSHLHTISELLDSNHMEEEVIPTDLDPPAYEDPPDYDDVIKVGMDEYFQKQANDRRSHRSKPNNICQQILNAVVMGAETENIPSTISIVTIDQEVRDMVATNDLIESQPTDVVLTTDLVDIEPNVSSSSIETAGPAIEDTAADGVVADNSSGIWSFFDSSPTENFSDAVTSDTLVVMQLNASTTAECLQPEMVTAEVSTKTDLMMPVVEPDLIFDDMHT